MRRLCSKVRQPDLAGRPTMVTVRGQVAPWPTARSIADSKTKLITVLLYLNANSWKRRAAGCARCARRTASMTLLAEVPPDAGTLLAFKVTPNSWHGHEPFEGQRRAISAQLGDRSGCGAARAVAAPLLGARQKLLPF